MTKAELREKVARAILDMVSSLEFLQTLHRHGLSVASEGCTEGAEPPLDTIDVCITVQGIERSDARVVQALTGLGPSHPDWERLPMVGVRANVDGVEIDSSPNYKYFTVGI